MALRVEKQIARLQVSVQQISRMHELQALQVLVDDVLLVDVLEDVSSDDGMQVSIHEVKDQVNITIVFGSNHILKSDYVLVACQFLQEDNLAKSSLRISSILESVKVLLELSLIHISEPTRPY